MVFLHTSDKSAIQNIPFMCLLSLLFFTSLYKQTEPENWKLSHRISSFSVIKKTVPGVKGKRGKFVLFLSLFLSVHINFQYIWNYHKILFIKIANSFSSIALLNFSNLQVYYFSFQLFFIYYKEYEWVLSLQVSCFVFNFNSRESRQTLSLIWNDPRPNKVPETRTKRLSLVNHTTITTHHHCKFFSAKYA